MDDDERKEIIAAGARAFMESSGLYKLPGHKSRETDCSLWKLVRDGWCDNGKNQIWVYKCPRFGRFSCKCQVKITENSNFHLLETRGVHNVRVSQSEERYSKASGNSDRSVYFNFFSVIISVMCCLRW